MLFFFGKIIIFFSFNLKVDPKFLKNLRFSKKHNRSASKAGKPVVKRIVPVKIVPQKQVPAKKPAAAVKPAVAVKPAKPAAAKKFVFLKSIVFF